MFGSTKPGLVFLTKRYNICIWLASYSVHQCRQDFAYGVQKTSIGASKMKTDRNENEQDRTH